MKSGFKFLSASALFTLALTTFSDSVVAGGAEVAATPNFKYMPRFSTGPFYQTRNGAFGLYDLFLPYTIDTDSLLFLDGRYIDRGATHEYNVGAGYRSIASSGNFLWSLYTFFDDRKSRFNNYFKQITVGADFQTDNWYFNTNGYIPVGKTQAFVGAFNTAILSNQRIYYARGIERSMGGWDAEVGRTIWGGLKGYVGAYVFARNGVKTAAGPNVRLEYDIQRQDQHKLLYIFDKIVLIGNYRTDNLVGTTWYGGARFDIGFGAQPKMTILQRKMTSFIRRDINVELSSDGKTPLHQPFNVLRNTFNGAETVVHQDATAAAFDADAGNAAVNIVGVVGSYQMATSDKQLADNQVIEGGVYSFTRDGQRYSVQVGRNGGLSLAAADEFLLVGDTGAAGVGRNNLIENMTFTYTGAATATDLFAVHDVINTDKGTLIVRHNTVNNAELVGLTGSSAGATSTVTIEGNRVFNGGTTLGDQAVVHIVGGAVATGNIDATINNNIINSVADNEIGIRIDGPTVTGALQSVAITNNTITTAGSSANPLVESSILLQNNAAVGQTTDIEVRGDVSGNVLTNTALEGAAFTAISQANAGASITFLGDVRNNTFISSSDGTTGGSAGVVNFHSQAATTLTMNGAFRNNTVTNNGPAGAIAKAIAILATDTGSTTTFNGGIINNTVTFANGHGFYLGNGGAVDGTVNIRNFYGNSIATPVTSAGIYIHLNNTTSRVHIWIGDGRTVGGSVQLQSANNNATYGTNFINGATAAQISINP